MNVSRKDHGEPQVENPVRLKWKLDRPSPVTTSLKAFLLVLEYEGKGMPWPWGMMDPMGNPVIRTFHLKEDVHIDLWGSLREHVVLSQCLKELRLCWFAVMQEELTPTKRRIVSRVLVLSILSHLNSGLCPVKEALLLLHFLCE